MSVDLFLATSSPHKAEELSRMLGGQAVQLVPGWVAPLEDGESFRENALIKARAGRERVPHDAWVVADDSGLVVAALDGAPGVQSARFGGDGLDDAGRNAHLIAALAEVPADLRGASYVCVLAAIAPWGDELVVAGHLDGTIAEAGRGSGGFGYDPLFIPLGETRTVGELSAAEKDAISHRGEAARALAAALAR